MKKGDLVLAHFPFTDLSGKKLRPCLVLASENAQQDIILAFVTTQIDKQEETSIRVPKLPSTGLKKESLVRLSRIATLNKTVTIGKIGTIPVTKIQEINDNLKKLFVL